MIAGAVRRQWLVVLLLAPSLIGCSLIQFQGLQIAGSMRGAGLERRQEDIGDARVNYWIGGEDDRTPVLLIHGFGASAMWQWVEQVPALAAERPVIMPDLLFFGGSSSRVRDFSLDHQVRTMVALLDHLEMERVDVVGISYGGLIAYELASAHPERVRRMVIVDSPGREYTRADYDELTERFGVSHLGTVLVPRDAEGVRALLGLAYAHPPFLPDFVLGQAQSGLYSDYRYEKVALLDALLDDLDELRGRPDPSAEALLIWGDEDPVFPLAIARRLARRLRARLAVIEDTRHAPNLERPARFNEVLLSFLNAPARDGSER